MGTVILIVDDDAHVRAALLRLLRGPDRDLLAAASGEEALEILARRPVQVVITDEKMPFLTGRELLARVREAQPGCRRILLTGCPERHVVHGALAGGLAHRVVLKPWLDGELNPVLREVLRDL